MTLGKKPLLSDTVMPRRAYFGSIPGLAAAVLLLAMALLAGCGGGSSSNPNPNPSASPGSANSATITGRVVDRYAANAGVAGVAVSLGGATSTVTGTDGTFTLNVRAGLGDQTLRLAIPAGSDFYDNASIQGTTYAILSSGVTVPDLTAAQTYSLGEIVLSSRNGPPPPPIFPQQ